MKKNKPQRGNPHQLTLKQHCFPSKSIARFAGLDGCVQVKLLEQEKQLSLKPENELFCAKRTWDQRAETGYMKEIEDRYQQLADSIIQRKVQVINKEWQSAVTDMFALWNIRWLRNEAPIPDQYIENIIDTTACYTKDEQEQLEKIGISVITDDFRLSGRHLSGMNIQQNLFLVRKQMADVCWGILQASKGEFIVPDNFSSVSILPLSPNICLFSKSGNVIIDEADVKKINFMAIKDSKKYYFSRDFRDVLM